MPNQPLTPAIMPFNSAIRRMPACADIESHDRPSRAPLAIASKILTGRPVSLYCAFAEVRAAVMVSGMMIRHQQRPGAPHEIRDQYFRSMPIAA
jgi:hypothetical protein